MKFRNFIIVLFALLMVFALASCNQDPKVKPNPEPEPEPVYSESLIYKLTATKGRNTGWWSADKFVLSFNLTGHQVKVNKGDVLTLKYRSTREITMFNIRNSVGKWIYEQPANDRPLPEGFLSTPDEDGWITVTYKFDADNYYKEKDKELTPISYPADFRIDFIGEIVTTDVLEVKDIAVNDTPLTLTEAQVKDSGAYGNIMPTYEETHDGTWQESADWVVFFFEGEPGSSDSTPEYERVFDGMNFTRDWAKGYEERANYTLKLLTDYKPGAAEYDGSPITANTRLFITYVGNAQNVTFNSNGGSAVEAQVVEYGKYATKPEDPSKDEVMFAGWYDAEDKLFDFEETAITADTVLTAKWGAPTDVLFDTQVSGLTVEKQTIPAGTTATEPDALTREHYRFDGWFTAATCKDEEKFDFNTPISSDTTLYAGWTEAKMVTFNENFGESPKTGVVYVLPGEKVDEPTSIPPVPEAGYIFGGWYKDSGCTDDKKFDFDSAVTDDIVLYAKWTLGTLYKLVAIHSDSEDLYTYDKIGIKYSDAKVSDGDVLSFRYRSTRPFTFFSVRGAKKWVYQNDKAENNYGLTTYETKADGWTYVTFVFDSTNGYDTTADQAKDAWFEFHFGNRDDSSTSHLGIVKGDILEIQGWAINGESLTIAESNVSGYAGATVATIEGGAYEWTAHDVTFETNEGSPIEKITVKFNEKVEKPANPIRAEKSFLGWFSDEDLSKEFSFDTLITEDTTLYAKWGDPVTLTFDAKGGTAAVASMAVGKGAPIEEPDEPAFDGYFFDGWYLDEAATETPFVFSSGIEEATTVYAKWTKAVTLTVNLNDATTGVKTFTVREGTTPVVQIARAGYFLSKLTEASSSDSTEYTVGNLTADKTVYAQWELPKTYYEFVGTKGTNGQSGDPGKDTWDKISLYFSENGERITVQPGDVISFAFKMIRDDTTKDREMSYSIRDPKKWFSEKKKSSSSAKYPQWFTTFEDESLDEWVYVTYEFPSVELSSGSEKKTSEAITYPSTFRIDFRDSVFAVGETLLIKGAALNGKPLVIDEDLSKNAYACPEIQCLDIE